MVIIILKKISRVREDQEVIYSDLEEKKIQPKDGLLIK